MSFFTIAIIVYVILMIVLEIVQSGKRRKTPTPPLEEYIPEKAVEKIREKWVEEKEETESVEKEEIEKTPEIEPKITPQLTKESVSEVKEEKEEKEEKRETYREAQEKIILKTLKDNDLLKLIIFKEILEPHPLTKRFLFKRRI